jgi:hypothetical protein
LAPKQEISGGDGVIGGAMRTRTKDPDIKRVSPWENGYIERFNACLRNELLDDEIFYSLREAQTRIKSWLALLQPY